MPTDPDIFTERIQGSVSQYTEDEYDILRCRFSKECDEIFSDREFMQKLNAVFPE